MAILVPSRKLVVPDFRWDDFTLDPDHQLSHGLQLALLGQHPGSGMAFDSGAFERDGVNTDLTYSPSANRQSMVFNGATSFSDIPSVEIGTGSPFTISAWVNRETTGGYQAICGYDSAHRLLISFDGTMLDQQGGNFFSANAAVPSGLWTHVAYWNDGTTARWFINGKQSGADWPISTAEWNSSFYVGKYTVDSTYILEGKASDVLIHNRALAGPEIETLASPDPTYDGWIQPIQRRDYWMFGGVDTAIYTRGQYAALPADDTNLTTSYSAQDLLDVADDDAVRVGQIASDTNFTLHQFKDDVGAETSATISCNLQSDLAPSLSTVYLQIYNHNTTTWDTKDTDAATVADTDFDLSANIADLTNYKDGTVISCRVYQENA